MTTPVLIACGTAIAIVVVLSIVFFKPVKALFGLLLHTVIGWAGLYIFNRIFAFCAPLASILQALLSPEF